MDTNNNANSTNLRAITFNASRRRFLTHTGTLASSTLVPTPAFSFPLTVNDTPPALFTSGIGFNGERKDPVTGGYHLGNGYRMYNPHLQQFHRYDDLSPFGQGGMNGYAYCLGDPINQGDPSGHFAILSLLIGAIVGAIIGSGISAISEGIQCAINPEHKFDWKQVGIGAALGFISGGFATAAKGATTSVKVGLAIVDATVSGGADFGLNVAAGTPVKQSGLNAGIGVLIGLSTFAVGLGVKTLGSSLSEANQRLAKIKTVGLSGRGAQRAALTLKIDNSHQQMLNDGVFFVHGSNSASFDGLTRFRALLSAEEIDGTPWFHKKGLSSGERGYTFSNIGTGQPISKGVSLNNVNSYQSSLHYSSMGDCSMYPVLYGIDGNISLSAANVGHPLSIGGIGLDHISRIYVPSSKIATTADYFYSRGFGRLASSIRSIPTM
ncbi:conserved hypothetical protein [Photobacterium leiognathi lrivu.4.1]|uniref:RHS repeat-associated core domain protein n=2 Tax=Photobacterium TaxID=657 RepID=V5H6H8_PHOLE|nr:MULTISPECIES: RHS repeat-associated core domain-containing protein [Photobacterium]EAS63335.1 hypothetical protein VAS14_16177 [Vibrio angustum S14] [Photobacterium angustum S14]GAD32582.1 conserved hypothetical protein [Photobacterium leiognathi lrivu.4.1]